MKAMKCVAIFVRIMTLIACMIVSFQALSNQYDYPNNLLSVSIIPELEHPSVGQTQTLALKMTPQAGWHGYWKNPGDAGFANHFKWSLPKGVTVGEFAYPAPSQLLTSGLMNYIYHGEYVLLAPLTISKDYQDGESVDLVLELNYLVCNPESCLPESQSLSTTLTVGDGAKDSALQNRFNQWQALIPKPINETGQFYTSDETFTLRLPLPNSVDIKNVDIKNAHVYPVINDLMSNSAAQQFTLKDDRLTMTTTKGDLDGDLFEGVLDLNNGTSLRFQAERIDASSALSGQPDSWKDNDIVLSIIAFLGTIAGGLLLNIMPCVFPILSLKILSIAHQGSEKEARTGALAYTFGAVLVCVVLGGIILALRALGHQVGWAFQLQSPVVIAALILLMNAIGFNLAGLYEIGTLTSGSRLQESKGLKGDFWTGVLAAFIATPCTGPFMATALGAALVLPVVSAFMIFAGLGFGMALPFLLVSFVPRLRTVLPKPGAWMVTARRILALPMFITVLGLLWILMRQASSDFTLLVISATMLSTFGLWLTGLWQVSQRKMRWWPAIVLSLLPLLVMVSWDSDVLAQPSQIEPNALQFDQAKLDELKTEHDVFLYFTADWCLTCKVNERTSIERDSVKEVFNQQGVVSMVGDWTNGDSAITQFLTKHKRSGVPLYLWYRKGSDVPEILPQILTPNILLNQLSEQ
ncbi:protein-disulfide reductase DsbD family protein [Photobacterium ganghwense]|uniref:protein-disulfide reductase DsbD family protein n=1 Tax=Photobacterium ganghwense TaxID=320778 RepID=UPI0020C3FDDF|nr:protein-disulfide reductase DsbD domain-containing protein [Photobacterium ganghwense]